MIKPGEIDSIRDIEGDPDEGALLIQLRQQPSDATVWSEYREKLKQLGENDRSKYVGLVWLLSQLETTDEFASDQERFLELRQKLSSYGIWMYCIERVAPILNCGQKAPGVSKVRFSYQCPNKWELLSPTSKDSVRYYSQCNENVYFCETRAEVEESALAGRCIAIPCDLDKSVGSKLIAGRMGRPDARRIWADEIYE